MSPEREGPSQGDMAAQWLLLSADNEMSSWYFPRQVQLRTRATIEPVMGGDCRHQGEGNIRKKECLVWPKISRRVSREVANGSVRW